MSNLTGYGRPPYVVRAYGLNGTGGVPISSNKGDIVGDVRLITTYASATGSFETTTTVAGEIQQTSGSNLSANEYYFYLVPQS
jgi:hypothetical protein